MKAFKTTLLCGAVALSFVGGAAHAQTRQFSIPAMTADAGIQVFARQAQVNVIASSDSLRGIRTNSVDGAKDVSFALQSLIRGTRLSAVQDGPNTYLIRQTTAPARLIHNSSPAPVEIGSTRLAEAGDAPQGLEEIVVTARRVEENQQKIPVAVLTISGNTLDQRSIKSVNDIQFSVPNLQIKPSSTYASRPEFIMRGQRQTLFTDENVVTYVNGVPQSTRGLTLYDMDSVQALKGPQGTLFGKNSNGGAMVFTTKQPVYRVEAGLDLEYGNYERMVATGYINVPIINDKMALRVAGRVERRDGFYRNVLPGNEDAGNLHNQSLRATLRMDPSESFTSTTTFDAFRRNEAATPWIAEAAPLTSTGFFGTLTAGLTQQAVTQQSALGGATPIVVGNLLVRQGNPFVVSKPTGLGPLFSSTHYDPLASNRSMVTVRGVSNTSSLTLSDNVTLRNILGYRYEESFDLQDSNVTSGMTLNISPALAMFGITGLPAVVPGQFAFNIQNYVNKDKVLTEEFQIIGKSERLNYIAGAFYSHRDHYYSAINNLVLGPVDINGVGPRFGNEQTFTNSYALFGQATYALTDQLHFTAGARYNWDARNYRGSNYLTDGNQSNYQEFVGGTQFCNELNGTGTSATGVNSATECAIFAKKTYKALTWTVSLDYQASPNTLLYVASRRGYKAGGPNPTTVNHDFAMFNPERLTDVELGLKRQGRIGGIAYRFNLAAFNGWYKNIQTQDVLTFCSNPPVCSASYVDLIILNAGGAHIRGIELDATILPFPSLQFDIGYSYQVGRYTSGSRIPAPANPGAISPTNPIDFNNGFDLSRKDFPGVPRQSLQLGATWRPRFGSGLFAKPEFNVNYAYRTRSFGLSQLGVYPSEGFGVFNARLALNDVFNSPVSVAVWGANLFNKWYRLTCSDNLGSISIAPCKWGEPRTYGITLSAKLK